MINKVLKILTSKFTFELNKSNNLNVLSIIDNAELYEYKVATRCILNDKEYEIIKEWLENDK